MKSPKDFEHLIYETKRGVAWLIWNEPERMNPFSLPRVREIEEAIGIAQDDDDAVIIAMKGQGRAFSGGAEIKPYRWGTGLEFFHSHRHYALPMWEKIWNSKKPIVAAIHGFCIGFALETALRCDIMIAAEGTQIGELEIQMSSPYGNQRIGRLASEKVQMWYSLTGDLMSVEEAERRDIINKVVPPDKLDDAVYEFCDKLKRWSPTALWLNRIAIKYGMNTDEKTGWLIEAALEVIQSRTDDWAEGLDAFQTKPRRTPHFTNKIPHSDHLPKTRLVKEDFTGAWPSG